VTDLRKLLDAATKGPWTDTVLDNRYVCVIKGSDKRLVCESSWHSNSSRYPTQSGTESNFALIVAAVNALPALLDVVEAAQRLQEWEDRASWLSANRPAFGSEPIYTTWWRASTKHDAARPAIAEALTAALAQWEKR